MKPAELVLSCGPPLLAILLQVFSIPNDRWLANAAAAEQRSKGLPSAATDAIKQTAKGAVAVAGLTPTVVSYATGAFALFAAIEAKRPDFINIYLLVVILPIVVSVIAVAMLIGRSLFRIATGRVRIPAIGFSLTPATWLALIVYILNGLVIALAVLIYKDWLPQWS